MRRVTCMHVDHGTGVKQSVQSHLKFKQQILLKFTRQNFRNVFGEFTVLRYALCKTKIYNVLYRPTISYCIKECLYFFSKHYKIEFHSNSTDLRSLVAQRLMYLFYS